MWPWRRPFAYGYGATAAEIASILQIDTPDALIFSAQEIICHSPLWSQEPELSTVAGHLPLEILANVRSRYFSRCGLLFFPRAPGRSLPFGSFNEYICRTVLCPLHLMPPMTPISRAGLPVPTPPDTDFPIQNLPFGVFRLRQSQSHIGVAIGEHIVDLSVCIQQEVLSPLPEVLKVACLATNLNPLMALGQKAITVLRHQLSHLLQLSTTPPEQQILVPMADVQMLLPAQIGNYNRFLCFG